MNDVHSKIGEVVAGLAAGYIEIKVCEWYESNSKGTRVIIESPFVEIPGHLELLGEHMPFWLRIGDGWYSARKIDPKSTEKRLGLVVKGPIKK